jgi:hypothetical protein
MARESREVWAERVERWRTSGLTADEFAAEIGVKGNTLRHWSWLLGREERRSGVAPAKGGRSRELAFVEVVAPAASAVLNAEPIEVVHVARRDSGRPGHLHGLLQLPPHPPGLPRRRSGAGSGALRPHGSAADAPSHSPDGSGGAARQLISHQAPRTGRVGETLDLYIRRGRADQAS